MSIPARFSIRARGASFAHAFRGLRFMLQSQHNARLHVVATFLVGLFGVGFHISRVEWCFVILSMMSVWTAESFNTAIECVTDLACPEFHSLAGKAKDVAAAEDEGAPGYIDRPASGLRIAERARGWVDGGF